MNPTNQADACVEAARIARRLTSGLPEPEMEFLAAHLESCDACRRRAMQDRERAALEDDLKWANREAVARAEMNVPVPLRRISELLPDYQIVREIARGGMGVVYEAVQLKLNRRVALKVLPALLGAVRPDAATRFRREAELTARLKHNNIIAVHDFGEADGTFYYTMELVDGRSLRDILDEIETTGAVGIVLGQGSSASTMSRPSVLAPHSSASGGRAYYRQVATWLAEVAEAVHYAHSQGVIHRDIKPSNMILARDGRLMIADFGLAKLSSPSSPITHHSSLTRSHALLGTARYMSPEQADPRNGPVGQATDVYGLGATLYEMLTLRPMFAGKDDVDVIQSVLHKEPIPPRRLVRQVPRELETICLKAVEKSPAARYATAQELADDLRRWLLGMPIEARRQRWPARAMKFARRRKLAVAAGAAVVVLLAVSFILFVRSSHWQADAIAAKAQADAQELELVRQSYRQLIDEGKYELGLARIENALGRYPDDAQSQVARAFVLDRLHQRERAIKSLHAFLETHPACPEAHYMLARLYSKGNEREKAAEHVALYDKFANAQTAPDLRFEILAAVELDPAKRLELINKALELNPNNISNFLTRSYLHGKLRQHSESLADAKLAVSMRPNWAGCHGFLGRALIRAGRADEAIEAFGRAIELDPKDAQWWSARAVARSNNEQYEAAVFDANRTIEINPAQARAYSCRGKARALLGEPGAGLQDCAKAIELDPKNSENFYERLCIYHLLGDWARLADDAASFIELEPNDPRGYRYRGDAYFRRSLYEQALADYTHSLELDPGQSDVLNDRGVTLSRLGRAEDAIADFDRSIAIDPKHTSAFNNRAIERWQLGLTSEAMADFTRAIELGLASPEAFIRRARLSLRLGQYEQAIADCTRVLERSPTSVEASLQRGMAYELLGQQDKALADYDRVATTEGPNAPYGWLWKHFMRPEIAGQAPATSDDATWAQQLVTFAQGRLSADALLTVAASDNERAEAYYYIGCDALIAGRTADSGESFEACVALRRLDILETDFARARLAQSAH